MCGGCTVAVVQWWLVAVGWQTRSATRPWLAGGRTRRHPSTGQGKPTKQLETASREPGRRVRVGEERARQRERARRRRRHWHHHPSPHREGMMGHHHHHHERKKVSEAYNCAHHVRSSNQLLVPVEDPGAMNPLCRCVHLAQSGRVRLKAAIAANRRHRQQEQHCHLRVSGQCRRRN